MRHGKGKQEYRNGDIYEGIWEHDLVCIFKVCIRTYVYIILYIYTLYIRTYMYVCTENPSYIFLLF